MTRLHPDQSVLERQRVIEDALAEVLKRGPHLYVEYDQGDRYLCMIDGIQDVDPSGTVAYRYGRVSLERIARELEVLLS